MMVVYGKEMHISIFTAEQNFETRRLVKTICTVRRLGSFT
jgi:hypothetical protein